MAEAEMPDLFRFQEEEEEGEEEEEEEGEGEEDGETGVTREASRDSDFAVGPKQKP
jgi:hypothetical protein